MNPYEAPRDVETRPVRHKSRRPFPILGTAITFAAVSSAVALVNFAVLSIMGGSFDHPHALQGPILVLDIPGLPLFALLDDWIESKMGFSRSLILTASFTYGVLAVLGRCAAHWCGRCSAPVDPL